MAFATGALFSGIAGTIFAAQLQSVYPHSMNFLVSINVLSLIIIGGMGSILGSIFGAMFMTLLPEVLKLTATSLSGVYPQSFGLIASGRDVIFGLAIIAFLIFEPAGLARIWLRVRTYWQLWPYSF
jgi:branched-chain amino acid transport system permease protein